MTLNFPLAAGDVDLRPLDPRLSRMDQDLRAPSLTAVVVPTVVPPVLPPLADPRTLPAFTMPEA